jgi:hypothetical protein
VDLGRVPAMILPPPNTNYLYPYTFCQIYATHRGLSSAGKHMILCLLQQILCVFYVRRQKSGRLPSVLCQTEVVTFVNFAFCDQWMDPDD